jgi:trk system potassium uptake protein TrkA
LFIVIVGAGGAGYYLTKKLVSDEHKIVVIDNNPAALEELKHKIPEISIILGDGSKLEILRRAGLDKADSLILLTGIDEKNLSIGMLAKNEFEVPRVIARVNDPKHAWLFDEHSGIDHSINRVELIVDEVMSVIE